MSDGRLPDGFPAAAVGRQGAPGIPCQTPVEGGGRIKLRKLQKQAVSPLPADPAIVELDISRSPDKMKNETWRMV